MKKAREFDNILEECLERVLFKGETIEQCLAGYPRDAGELEPLLRAALAAREAAAIKPSPEFRERAGHRFQEALREMEPEKKSRGFFSGQPRWATVVMVVIVLLLAGSGTVAAAGRSLPGEPLYQVKLVAEAVQLKLTLSDQGKEELYVKLADRRVAEIIKMAEAGEVAQVESTTMRLDAALVAMANLAVPRLVIMMDRMQPESAEAPPMLGATVPAPTTVTTTEPPPAGEEPPALSAPRAPGNGPAEKAGLTDLKSILLQHAVENMDALQEVLARAPAEVRPALRWAIEVADAGYERALASLDQP